jgi:hypothetical protein
MGKQMKLLNNIQDSVDTIAGKFPMLIEGFYFCPICGQKSKTQTGFSHQKHCPLINLILDVEELEEELEKE